MLATLQATGMYSLGHLYYRQSPVNTPFYVPVWCEGAIKKGTIDQKKIEKSGEKIDCFIYPFTVIFYYKKY